MLEGQSRKSDSVLFARSAGGSLRRFFQFRAWGEPACNNGPPLAGVGVQNCPTLSKVSMMSGYYAKRGRAGDAHKGKIRKIGLALHQHGKSIRKTATG